MQTGRKGRGRGSRCGGQRHGWGRRERRNWGGNCSECGSACSKGSRCVDLYCAGCCSSLSLFRTHTHRHTHTRTHTHTYINAFICAHTHTHMRRPYRNKCAHRERHTHKHTYTHTHSHARTHAHTHTPGTGQSAGSRRDGLKQGGIGIVLKKDLADRMVNKSTQATHAIC